MQRVKSPLARRRIAMASDSVECVACGGSGAASKGGPCHPCQGTGSRRTPATDPTAPLVYTQESGVETQVADAALPQHLSKTAEHFTPEPIVAAAREVLGEIDLDPASCELAQEVVRASAWYGPGSPFGENGLAEPWLGRVFLNPPGGRVPEAYQGMGTSSSAALWWATLASAWKTGEVEAAIFVGFTLEILRSAQALDVPQPLDFPLCVPSSRIAFDTEADGKRVSSKQPTHANVIVYLPHTVHLGRSEPVRWDNFTNVERFHQVFRSIGRCRA